MGTWDRWFSRSDIYPGDGSGEGVNKAVEWASLACLVDCRVDLASWVNE